MPVWILTQYDSDIFIKEQSSIQYSGAIMAVVLNNQNFVYWFYYAQEDEDDPIIAHRST